VIKDMEMTQTFLFGICGMFFFMFCMIMGLQARFDKIKKQSDYLGKVMTTALDLIGTKDPEFQKEFLKHIKSPDKKEVTQ